MAANQQQSEAWNGAESTHYVDHADRYDRQLAPFTDALNERARLGAGDSVLDVGCGCGATTLAAAGAARSALGADLSAPLVAVAAERARAGSVANVDFLVADAQTDPFEAGPFDVIISQFGLMFFDDPIAAFTNLGRALAPDGRMVFVCWQGLDANEWLMVVADALRPHVELPTLGGLTRGPGMFALQDPEETSDLLGAAGFTSVEVEPLSPAVVLGGGGTLDGSLDFLLGTGMTRGLLSRVDADGRPGVIADVRAALTERYEPGTGVRLGTAGWLVTASR